MSRPYTQDERLITTLCLIFLRPLFLAWCWDYFQDDFALPEFGYWKCFWLLFALAIARPPYYATKNEFYSTEER